MTRIVTVSGIAVALLIAVLAVPVKDTCPHGPCTTGIDAQGNIHRYYEVRPLGVHLVGEIARLQIPIYYTAGYDSESVR